MTAGAPDAGDLVRRWTDEHRDRLIAFRRDLHAHPELSAHEFRTTNLLERVLVGAGYDVRRLTVGTGLIADTPNSSGRRRALRADIDALAMDDRKDVEYRSTVDGVAHACGHDLHTTTVLGAAMFFAEHPELARRPLRFLFQPAEERVPGGALDVLADDGLADVETVVGLHCEPKLEYGTIGLKSGPITSASDMLQLDLAGPGGHTARPELTVDLISIAARIVDELPSLVAAEVARGESERTAAKVVFGAIHAGDAANAIPTRCTLRASVRTPSSSAWENLEKYVTAAIDRVLAGCGATRTITYVSGVPPVVNDADVIDHVRSVAESMDDVTIVDAHQSWGGDDFAWFTREVPSAYVRLGTHRPGTEMLDLHAGQFDVDERAIALGTRLLIRAAMS